MPKVAPEDLITYGGALQKIERLGLAPLFEEVKEILTGFTLLVKEEKDANGGKTLREIMDKRFAARGDWSQKVTGDVDWTKCRTVNGSKVCMGVEVQLSGRSDLVTIDLIHLRRGFTSGLIDVGLLVVPNDRLGYFLTDRVARQQAKRTRKKQTPKRGAK